MKTLLFGGSFDPPHLAHQQIPRTVLDQKIADEVWFVPAKQHPFFKPLSPDHHRLAMLKFCLPPNEPRIRIETWELEQREMSYSWKTLEALSAKYPDRKFSWLVGSDNLPKFSSWFQAEELLQKYGVVVYPRSGYPVEPLLKGMQLLPGMPESDLSSTKIKTLILAGKSFEHLVPPEVANYIHEQGVYPTQG